MCFCKSFLFFELVVNFIFQHYVPYFSLQSFFIFIHRGVDNVDNYVNNFKIAIFFHLLIHNHMLISLFLHLFVFFIVFYVTIFIFKKRSHFSITSLITFSNLPLILFLFLLFQFY